MHSANNKNSVFLIIIEHHTETKSGIHMIDRQTFSHDILKPFRYFAQINNRFIHLHRHFLQYIV